MTHFKFWSEAIRP